MRRTYFCEQRENTWDSRTDINTVSEQVWHVSKWLWFLFITTEHLSVSSESKSDREARGEFSVSVLIDPSAQGHMLYKPTHTCLYLHSKCEIGSHTAALHTFCWNPPDVLMVWGFDAKLRGSLYQMLKLCSYCKMSWCVLCMYPPPPLPCLPLQRLLLSMEIKLFPLVHLSPNRENITVLWWITRSRPRCYQVIAKLVLY